MINIENAELQINRRKELIKDFDTDSVEFESLNIDDIKEEIIEEFKVYISEIFENKKNLSQIINDFIENINIDIKNISQEIIVDELDVASKELVHSTVPDLENAMSQETFDVIIDLPKNQTLLDKEQLTEIFENHKENTEVLACDKGNLFYEYTLSEKQKLENVNKASVKSKSLKI